MTAGTTHRDAFEVTGDHDLTVTAGVPTQLLVWSFDD